MNPESVPVKESHKSFKYISYNPIPQSNWCSRHVQWMKEERQSWLMKAGILTLGFLEGITGIGLYILYRHYQESKRSEIEKGFFEKNREAISPPKDRIKIKTDTRTFNHVFDLAIENKLTWWRLRHTGEWQLFYFDGYATGREPVQIDADGANLQIRDNEGYMHRKKTMREYAIEKLLANPKALEKIEGQTIDLKDRYIVIGKMEKNNWKTEEFTLPIAHYLYYFNPFQQERRLYLASEETACWSVSHRGQYNRYAEDGRGHPYEVEVGVSNLFRLKTNKKDISGHDPWSPPFATTDISLPETTQTTFAALKIKSSASVLMAIGYEIQATGKGTLKVLTRMTDADYELWNPIFSADYFEHPDNLNVRVYPRSEWVDHLLILEDQTPIQDITIGITITQIGEGNHARKLYIGGNKDGCRGYYVKHLTDKFWCFKPIPNSGLITEGIVPLTIDSTEPFETTVHDYCATHCWIKMLPNASLSAKLFQFGQRSSESILALTIDHQAYHLRIHRRKNLKNFLGFPSDSFDLIIPQELHQDQTLMRAFQGLKVVPLTIIEEKEDLRVSSLFFQFQFN